MSAWSHRVFHVQHDAAPGERALRQQHSSAAVPRKLDGPVIELPGDVVRRIEVIETNIERRGDGSKDDPTRRVTQFWSLDGQLLAERDDLAPTHCRAVGHRVMPGDTGCHHCGAKLAELVKAVRR